MSNYVIFRFFLVLERASQCFIGGRSRILLLLQAIWIASFFQRLNHKYAIKVSSLTMCRQILLDFHIQKEMQNAYPKTSLESVFHNTNKFHIA